MELKKSFPKPGMLMLIFLTITAVVQAFVLLILLIW